jgi:hypothetical protein
MLSCNICFREEDGTCGECLDLINKKLETVRQYCIISLINEITDITILFLKKDKIECKNCTICVQKVYKNLDEICQNCKQEIYKRSIFNLSFLKPNEKNINVHIQQAIELFLIYKKINSKVYYHHHEVSLI